jgi:hypothetical protein
MSQMTRYSSREREEEKISYILHNVDYGDDDTHTKLGHIFSR